MSRRRKKARARQVTTSPNEVPTFAVNTLPAMPARMGDWHGEKFPGGLGQVDILQTDYWTLRKRSAALFKTSLYAKGLIRRILDNLINTGLHLEAVPEEQILGYQEDELGDWTETVENRFKLWESSPRLCDSREEMTFGELQECAKREALLEGDILVILLQDETIGCPRVQLVSGSRVQSPLRQPEEKTNRIEHGIELDAMGRQVAFWILQDDFTSKRVSAFGPKTGRRMAWMVYGSERRFDEVRGEPLLSSVMQSLREIDRYRDSAQRKAVVNSMLAMFIKRTENQAPTRPITSGAVRRGLDTVADPTGTARSFRTMDMIPGLVLDELAQGEEPHGFVPSGTDEKFSDFEAAILAGVAFANGIPPEIYRLFFSDNYSASQAAINEFKMVLNKERARFGERFCAPIYKEWLLSEVLARRISAQGLLESWRDPLKHDVYAAWTQSDWSGHIKPAVDLSKLVRGYSEEIREGLITRGRACRELTGMRYSKVIQQLKRENEQWAEATAPVSALENPAPVASEGGPGGDIDSEDDDDDDDDTPPRNARVGLRVVGKAWRCGY